MSKIELIQLLHSKRVNNDITLATLKTLNGINGNLTELRYVELLNALAYHGNLIAIRHNNPTVCSESKSSAQNRNIRSKHHCHHFCFLGVDLI